jgi:hypothetical protein
MPLEHLPHLRLSVALEISPPADSNAATILAPDRSVPRPETLHPGFRFILGSFFPFQDPLPSDIYSKRMKSFWHTREELIR